MSLAFLGGSKTNTNFICFPPSHFLNSHTLTEALATFVNVILPLHLNRLYTYRVPNVLMEDVAVGKRVIVQFGKTRVYSALVHSIHNQPPAEYEAKYINSVLDESPLISQEQLNFWQWMAEYYMCSLGDVMNAALPAPFKLASESTIILNPEFDKNSIELDDREYLIIEALELQDKLSIAEISSILGIKNVFPFIKSLVIKEAILTQEIVEDKYKEKFKTCIALHSDYESEEALHGLFNLLEKKANQLNVLMAYMQLKHEHKDIDKKLLLSKSGASAAVLKTLCSKNIFTEYKVSVDRILLDNTLVDTFELNEYQQKAYDEIQASFKQKEVCLLHGITSSGKTHIYIKLINEQLAIGKQVLFMLPEIALSTQIINRVRKYFGNQAIAFHSKFNDNERVEIWNKVKQRQCNVVIGPRSSLFLPFSDLGLIIVDEEHEQTYKQQEPSPRFHARDSAIVLANQSKAKVLLGSATPAFETYFNCKADKFGLVQLNQRFDEILPPEIILANIAEENRVKTLKGNFTSVLVHEIEKTLANKEQVILFQNRRGFAPVIECHSCHWIPKCQNCDISLTYHKAIDSLKCHYCSFTMKVPAECGACGSHLLNYKGFGTEKVEEELETLFPNARIGRLDLDAAKSKHGHEKIIQDFEDYKFDILVGTQMLSKGLDFEKVSLVGIINADQLLHFPDFRASERAFQLITQVGGRAGRKNKQGRVVIQTSSPAHPIIQSVLKNAYEEVYSLEMIERSNYAYPPMMRVIKITIKHKEYKTAEHAAILLLDMLMPSFGDNIIGPASPYVSKIRNYYIKELLIKIDRNNKHLKQLKKFTFEQISKLLSDKNFRSVIIFADVDAA